MTTATTEEPKPAASLSAASVKRRMALFEAPPIPPADLSPQAGKEGHEGEGTRVQGTDGLRVKSALIFGAIYVGALLFFAAAFDVWSVVLG